MIHCGDNIEILKTLADNSVDSVVTDPPYGLSFMGKHWDYDVPKVEFWKEVVRVLKPGGHVLSFCGTRTYHRMVVNLEDAGFDIRDCIVWHYGSGFPKSLDISKAIDKQAGVERERTGEYTPRHSAKAKNNIMGDFVSIDYDAETGKQFSTIPSLPEAKQWNGWGTALKPASELICLARKPLSEKTVAENVLKLGTGGINIDGCRISTDNNLNGGAYSENKQNDGKWGTMHKFTGKEYTQPQGRFPANVIFECICDEVREGGVVGNGHFPKEVNMEGHTLYEGGFKNFKQEEKHLKEKRIIHTNKNCPCFILDHQAPKTGAAAPVASGQKGFGGVIYGKYATTGDDGQTYYEDGLQGASRFFYVAKASKSERNFGLDGLPQVEYQTHGETGIDNTGNSHNTTGQKPAKSQNFHPTVKPVKLMQYLVRLITPPNGTCLDPFAGSGTTGIACKLEGFNFIGMEREPDYVKIAQARIEAWQPEEEESTNQLQLF